MGDWKQGKCGWWLEKQRRRCGNKTKKGTSRCYLHQGDWTKAGQALKKKRQEKKASKHRTK